MILWEIGHLDPPQAIEHKRVLQHFLMLQKPNENEKEPRARKLAYI